MKRKLFQAAAVASMAAMLVGATAGASYADPALDAKTQKDIEQIDSKLVSHGVEADVRKSLIAKFLRGEQIDADTGQNLVSETEAIEGNKTVTRYVYADGSVAKSGMDIAVDAPVGGQPTTLGISGCRKSQLRDAVDFKNCNVTWSAVTWDMGYWVDYGYYQFGNWMGKPRGLTIAGNGEFSSPQADNVVATCNTNCSSMAIGTYLQNAGGAISRTVGIKVDINNQRKSGKSYKIG